MWAELGGHHDAHAAGEKELPDEDTVVSGAVRTDFILSAEVMVISLNQVVRGLCRPVGAAGTVADEWSDPTTQMLGSDWSIRAMRGWGHGS